MNPDLILLDVVLPDMEGYELFEKIKEKDENHAPVIFITSKDSEQDVIRGSNWEPATILRNHSGRKN